MTESMSDVATRIGRVVWPALRASKGQAGIDALMPLFEAYPPGGIIVFGEGQERVDRLIAALRLRAGSSLIVAADLERGCGQHVREFSSLPPAMAIAASPDPGAAHEAGLLTAIEARQAGIDMVFAPVADVNTANTNPIIATRSFGDDPHDVAARASAFAAGLAEGGVLAVAKHFPGHGSTVQDSHDVLARVTRTIEELESIDLVPFRTLIAEDIAGIMVGHLEVPALDPVSGRPATASPNVVLDHLRHRLGYDGLVITDAMDMGGFPRAEAAALDVLQSGLDVLLMPSDPLATARSLHEAQLKGWLADETLDAAVAHIDRATDRLAERASASRQPRPDLPEALLEDSLTTGSTPLPRLTAGQPVLVDVFGDDPSGIVAPSFRESLEAAGMIDGSGGMTIGLVLTSVAAHLGRSRLDDRPRKRLAWALEHGKLDVVVVLGSPYELLALPEQTPALLAYEATPAAAAQTVRVLMGSAPAPGLLPVGQGS
jgi:beta-glucosidase-like glycosyl hydrolase